MSVNENDWLLCSSQKEFELRATEMIEEFADEAIRTKGHFSFVLAGGNTPKKIYETLSTKDCDWANWHIYFGDDFSLNEEDGELQGGKYRYVVYIPFATQESTGLSLRPNGQGHPWLMNPGTHRAHIMISPPE